MVIELLQKSDQYMVRFKTIWPWWWYHTQDGAWFWPGYGSLMSKEDAETFIDNLKDDYELDQAETKVVERTVL